MKKEKRISFGEYDADRIYEWRLAMNQGLGERCCDMCTEIEKRLEKFTGKKSAEFLKRQIKKHPYFKNGCKTAKENRTLTQTNQSR